MSNKRLRNNKNWELDGSMPEVLDSQRIVSQNLKTYVTIQQLAICIHWLVIPAIKILKIGSPLKKIQTGQKQTAKSQ